MKVQHDAANTRKTTWREMLT